jgi:bifunctional non-homologous end joining protein LigD
MDRLAEYRDKRDASRTPEPIPPASGAAASGDAGQPAADAPVFVVQEHHARRLHWDFRLERGGVLASWALPKGVPDDPAVNHLAVRTEDHPLEYARFHGQIPRGEYGAGTVTLWDHGTYELVKWSDREVKVILRGERLAGGYALFATGRADDKNWMIHRERLPLPLAIRPMLATPGSFPGHDADAWAVEMKWDGVRALAFIESGRLTLRSRTGKDISAAYPELAGLGAMIGGKEPGARGGKAASHRQALLDGEVVAFNDAGTPDFEALQRRMHVTDPDQARRLAGTTPVTYIAFDLLQLDGRPLAGLAYRLRRDMLASLVRDGPFLLAPPGFPGADFDAVLAASAANGLEGVVAKRLDSRYVPGARSGNWRKIKNELRQEVVVAGWKPGKGNRAGKIGSLLVGVHESGGLVYCGHVGTGFTDQALGMIGERLAALRRASSPFGGMVPAEQARQAVWVEPRLVIDVAFARWTQAGRMRAPSYKGLRDDKDPREVVRET